MLTHSTYFIPFYQLNKPDKNRVDVPSKNWVYNDIESNRKSFGKGINTCKHVKPLFWSRLITWRSVRAVLVKFIEHISSYIGTGLRQVISLHIFLPAKLRLIFEVFGIKFQCYNFILKFTVLKLAYVTGLIRSSVNLIFVFSKALI